MITNSTKDPLSTHFAPQNFGRNVCFLCGTRLKKSNRSEEHVFPKWALRKFNLWNEHLTLLNGTDIAYRNLTIPCCTECNTRYLKLLESEVSEAVTKGISAVRKLDKWTLFAWTGKILYGVLYKELLLKKDRSKKRSSGIMSRKYLEQVRLHHMFLQSIRTEIEFDHFFPGSIILFETLVPDDVSFQWDFRDGPQTMFVSIRMGNVGIIAILQDGEAMLHSLGDLAKYRKKPLHPLQFREVSAILFYRSLLLNRTPKFTIVLAPPPRKVFMSPLAGFSLKPIFDPHNYTLYANVLAAFMGLTPKQVNPEPNKFVSWLVDLNGKFKHLDPNRR